MAGEADAELDDLDARGARHEGVMDHLVVEAMEKAGHATDHIEDEVE